jgi:hypothetical protein
MSIELRPLIRFPYPFEGDVGGDCQEQEECGVHVTSIRVRPANFRAAQSAAGPGQAWGGRPRSAAGSRSRNGQTPVSAIRVAGLLQHLVRLGFSIRLPTPFHFPAFTNYVEDTDPNRPPYPPLTSEKPWGTGLADTRSSWYTTNLIPIAVSGMFSANPTWIRTP